MQVVIVILVMMLMVCCLLLQQFAQDLGSSLLPSQSLTFFSLSFPLLLASRFFLSLLWPLTLPTEKTLSERLSLWFARNSWPPTCPWQLTPPGGDGQIALTERFLAWPPTCPRQHTPPRGDGQIALQVPSHVPPSQP